MTTPGPQRQGCPPRPKHWRRQNFPGTVLKPRQHGGAKVMGWAWRWHSCIACVSAFPPWSREAEPTAAPAPSVTSSHVLCARTCPGACRSARHGRRPLHPFDFSSSGCLDVHKDVFQSSGFLNWEFSLPGLQIFSDPLNGRAIFSWLMIQLASI